MKQPKRKPVKTRNPFYKGATPEQVARALLRHRPDKPPKKGPVRSR